MDEEIAEWCQEGRSKGAVYMITVSSLDDDGYDYPVYVYTTASLPQILHDLYRDDDILVGDMYDISTGKVVQENI